MSISNSVAMPQKSGQQTPRENAEMIDRMAADLRARSDTDLPHSFYVAQVRRQLAMRNPANDPSDTWSKADKKRPGEAHPSVFHSWAFSE